MEKATEQAEHYLQTKYPEMKYEISGATYNSVKKSGDYDYAAVILNTESQKSFLVYENRTTGKMEDDISIQEEVEFFNQLKPKIVSYINEKFGDTNNISLTAAYEAGSTHTLNIRINKKNEEVTEEMFLSFIEYLQKELKIEHARISIMYDNGNGIWHKDY